MYREGLEERWMDSGSCGDAVSTAMFIYIEGSEKMLSFVVLGRIREEAAYLSEGTLPELVLRV
jgi:hypothetical protein